MKQLAVGIDVGTAQVKAVIADSTPKIIGTGLAKSSGLERGYVIDPGEAARSIRAALNQAEKTAGIKVKRAHFGIGGVGLSCLNASGTHIISRADLEITAKDLDMVMEVAEANLSTASLANRKIINSIPVEYKVDGQPVWGRVEGLKGQKLEVKALFLVAYEHHLADLVKAAELAGVEVSDMVVSPVAASFVTLSKKQKKAGCVLADIGAETLSLVVFENDNLISLEVFPIGGEDLTADIALGLKVPLEEAEEIKHGHITRSSYPKKKLDEIIASRLDDSFELVEGHLRKIGRDSLLPAGIIISGGGAGLVGVKEFARDSLGLHAETAQINFGASSIALRDTIWPTACGLAMAGLSDSDIWSRQSSSRGGLINFKGHLQKIGAMLSRLLP